MSERGGGASRLSVDIGVESSEGITSAVDRKLASNGRRVRRSLYCVVSMLVDATEKSRCQGVR